MKENLYNEIVELLQLTDEETYRKLMFYLPKMYNWGKTFKIIEVSK